MGRLIHLFFLFLPLCLQGAFNSFDKDKIEILKHFDLPPSFLKDSYLHDYYDESKKEWDRDGFSDSAENCDMFIPLLSSLIAQSDLPSEFLYIAFTESRLATMSSSSRGASGLWQFVEKTGKLHGLTINQYVDERRDHIKSTRAAITYLSNLHQMFGKWYLALMAYNCGEGRLQKAIRKAKSTDVNVLADPKRQYIPKETRRYIRKVVAQALLASEEPFKSQIQTYCNNNGEVPVTTVYLPEGEDIDRIAAVLEMPKTHLKKLNTHLRNQKTPPTDDVYPVYIPSDKLYAMQQRYRTKGFKGFFVLHRAKEGETIASISKRYNVPVSWIQEENELDQKVLVANQKIRIPVNKPLLKSRFYIAQEGDTLISIAGLYQMSVEQLKEINPFIGTKLKGGERINVDK